MTPVEKTQAEIARLQARIEQLNRVLEKCPTFARMIIRDREMMTGLLIKAEARLARAEA